MRQAIVNVRDDDGAALGLQEVVGAFRAAGLTDVEVLSCEGSRTVVRADVETPVDIESLGDRPEVAWIEAVAGSRTGESYLLELDVSESGEAVEACSDGLVRCTAMDVAEDRVTLGMAGPQDAISETVAEYDRAGADVGLIALEDYEGRNGPLDALTDRQREVLEVAFETGFFDVPRSASTADVAAELDLDDSTVAEHLQRAERNLLSTVLPTSA